MAIPMLPTPDEVVAESPVEGAEPYRTVLSQAVRDFKPERALIMAREPQGLRMLAAYGFQVGDGQVIDLSLSLHLLEEVLATATPRFSQDLQAELGYFSRTSVLVSGVRALMCVPFWPSPAIDEPDDTAPTGLVYLDTRLAPNAFADRDHSELLKLARVLEGKLREPAPLPAAPEKARITVRAPAEPPPPATGIWAWLERMGSELDRWRLRRREKPQEPWKEWTCSNVDRVYFLRGLATMLAAGIRVDSALDRLAQEQYSDSRMNRVLKLVLSRVQVGTCLSYAFSLCPRAFPSYLLAMLRVAEESGSLVSMLLAAATYTEKLHELRQRIRAALLYPALVLGLTLAAMVLGLPWVLQSQLALLSSLGGKLSGWTLGLIGFLLVLSRPAALVAAIGLGVLTWFVLRRPGVRLKLYLHALRLPGLGRLLRILAARRFAQAYAVMIEVGISHLLALPLAASSSGSPVLDAQSALAVRALRDGRTLPQAVRELELLPPNFHHIIEVAAETGAYGPLLASLDRLYEWELEAALEAFFALLQPCVMLLLGGLVAVFMLATLLPMMQVIASL